MKLSIKPVALAVAMALGAVAAQAQTLPTMSTGTAFDNGANDGLYLAVWDNTSEATELVDLTSLYSNVAISGGTSILETPTVGSNGWTQVSNFNGNATVDQLNLGTVANFSSLFSTSSDYAVVASTGSHLGVLSTAALGYTYAGSVGTQSGSILGESADWQGTTNGTGPAIDTAGKANYNVVVNAPGTSGCSSTLCDGSENATGQNLGVNVGTAAGFYNWTKATSKSPTVLSTYSYNNGQSTNQGFFFLTSGGQLTWNLVAASSASTVPLPPAVWLFASGLLGLVAIGRRRQAGFGAAA